MKRFIYRLVIFYSPLLVLFIFVEYSLRHIDSGYKQKQQGLIAQCDSTEILIVGNSHAMAGINPCCFKRPAYNLAYASQTLLYDKQLILKYISILKNLKFVIISIDYPSLYWGFTKDRDFFYYYYYGINIRHKAYFKEYLSFFFYVYSPKTAIKLIFNRPTFKYVKGWVGSGTTDYANLTEIAGKRRVKDFNTDIESSIHSKENEYVSSELESLIQFLKQKNIIPILITAPCYKYYNDNLDVEVLKYNLQYLNKLKEKYHLIYLNSQNDLSFTAKDFYDNDHLNKYGAAQFTIKIDSLLNVIN